MRLKRQERPAASPAPRGLASCESDLASRLVVAANHDFAHLRRTNVRPKIDAGALFIQALEVAGEITPVDRPGQVAASFPIFDRHFFVLGARSSRLRPLSRL